MEFRNIFGGKKVEEKIDPEKEKLFDERDKEIKRKSSDVFKALPFEDFEKFWNEVVSQARYLEKKYPDHLNRDVWHVFIGSTPPERATIMEDFPGEDSVEFFIDKLAEKYLKK